MASASERGTGDSLSKTEILWSLPSSWRRKSSFFRPATGAPWGSVTVTYTLTSLTSTLRVSVDCEEGGGACGFWASAGIHRASKSRVTDLFIRRKKYIDDRRKWLPEAQSSGRADPSSVSSNDPGNATAHLDACPVPGLPRWEA